MKIETLSLNLPYEKLGANPAEVSLTGYILENFKNYRQDETRPAVIICPGGGYGAISEHETAPIAEAYIGAGISAFVLLYSIAPVRYPAQYIELCEAIATVRRHSAQWNIDENKIFVTGYSAGGHLAGCGAVLWDSPVAREYGYCDGINRPDGAILGYPVISAAPEWGHIGSFENLLGTDAPPALLHYLSLENRVSEKTPPVFLFHTRDDTVVPVSHSLVFATQLQKNNIPFELHIYNRGWHGMSLATKRTAWNDALVLPHCSDWLAKSVEWMELL